MSALSFGDHVTVVGMIDRQLHTCVVTELLGLAFRAREEPPPRVHDAPKYFSRDYEEEGIDWALGWDTPDVTSLHSLVALENCSR